MYLLTGCLCGEAPAARSRPPCRAGGFQAESRVAGAGGMRTPGGAWLRASARPHFHSKNWSVPDPAASPEAGNPPVSDRAVPPECSGGGRQAGLPREDCQTAVDSWGVSKHKCRRIPGSRPFPTAPPRWGTPSRGTTPHREIPGGGTRPGFAKDKIAKRCLARAASKRKRRQVSGSHSLPTTPPHRGAPSSGTRPGFAKGKIAKRCLAKGCVKAQTLSAFERSQSAVFPQGRARPVDCTGRPISSASTRPPRRGMRTAPSRWAITEGERPVV